MITDDIINEIKTKRVVITDFMLIQNTIPKDINYRLPQLMTGQSRLSFSEAKNIIPDGNTNDTVFAFGDGYEDWDIKCGFFCYAIVLDENRFYQWKIAEPETLRNKHYGWFKSEFFDLKPALGLYQEWLQFEERYHNNNFNDVTQIRRLYDRIEKERESIRNKIILYHNSKKIQFKNILTTMNTPPLYSFFDEVDVTEKGYLIATHLEPLFYRGAIRNWKLADSTNKKLQILKKSIVP